ncbi:unnamed protein product [Gadus morhua 'NCC']
MAVVKASSLSREARLYCLGLGSVVSVILANSHRHHYLAQLFPSPPFCHRISSPVPTGSHSGTSGRMHYMLLLLLPWRRQYRLSGCALCPGLLASALSLPARLLLCRLLGVIRECMQAVRWRGGEDRHSHTETGVWSFHLPRHHWDGLPGTGVKLGGGA